MFNGFIKNRWDMMTPCERFKCEVDFALGGKTVTELAEEYNTEVYHMSENLSGCWRKFSNDPMPIMCEPELKDVSHHWKVNPEPLIIEMFNKPKEHHLSFSDRLKQALNEA